MKKMFLILISVLLLMGCNNEFVNDNSVIIEVINDEEYLLKGIVESVGETSVQILVDDKSPYVVHLSDLMKSEAIQKSFAIGDEAIFGYSGEVMESYPMQIVATDIRSIITYLNGEIISIGDTIVVEDNKGNQESLDSTGIIVEEGSQMAIGDKIKLTIQKHLSDKKITGIIESGERITLDPREMVSGIIGQWPSMILEADGTVAEGQVFALSLPALSDGKTYEFVAGDLAMEMLGSGIYLDHEYFGFIGISSGSYELTFEVIDNDEVLERHKFTINVK